MHHSTNFLAALFLCAIATASYSKAPQLARDDRVTIEFASTCQLAPPDAIMVMVRLKEDDIYQPDLSHSEYVDHTGHRTEGLNVIEQNYDEYSFDGYSTRHYILLVPRPLIENRHSMSPGVHSVVFRYSLNGHQCVATGRTEVIKK